MKRRISLLLSLLSISCAFPASGGEDYQIDVRPKSSPYIERWLQVRSGPSNSIAELLSFMASNQEIRFRSVDGSIWSVPVKEIPSIEYTRRINDPDTAIQMCEVPLVQGKTLETITLTLPFSSLSIQNGILRVPRSSVPPKSRAALARRPLTEDQQSNVRSKMLNKVSRGPMLIATVLEPMKMYFNTAAKKARIDLETVEYARVLTNRCKQRRGPDGGKMIR